MIRKNNFCRVLLLCLSTALFSVSAATVPTPVVERILETGFPSQPAALASVTSDLLKEYERTDNVGALIFYSWGLLRQADYFQRTNDLINASEYAKTGFFYLDESVDANEDKLLIRYLRARVDAWLPASLGRCVITTDDTERLLQEREKLSPEIVDNINKMRLRALHYCHQEQQEKQLLQHIQIVNPEFRMDYEQSTSPAWDMTEVMQVIVPVIRGD
jgi:hypothetical protein